MSWLYVIRTPSGLRKIGMSVNVKQRLQQLKFINAAGETGEFVIEYTRQCLPALTRQAEMHAHALLWEFRTEEKRPLATEYFSVDAGAARAAVDAAVEIAETGGVFRYPGDAWPPPRSVGLTIDPELSAKIVRFRVTGRHRSMNAAIVALIEAGLAAKDLA